MTRKFKQHIPDFFEGFDKKEIYFENLEELLQDETLTRWSSDSKFTQFSLFVQPGREDLGTLMAEYKDKSFWVVGHITNPEGLDLPKWEYKDR